MLAMAAQANTQSIYTRGETPKVDDAINTAGDAVIVNNGVKELRAKRTAPT